MKEGWEKCEGNKKNVWIKILENSEKFESSLRKICIISSGKIIKKNWVYSDKFGLKFGKNSWNLKIIGEKMD